jgi:metallo-beta-lactamase family protein
MESTYGDRDHRDMPATLDELATILQEAHGSGGNVLVPVFAVGRAQELIHCLHDFERDGRITPRPVYLDSPMAIDVTDLYRSRPDVLAPKLRERVAREGDLLRTSDLRFTHTAAESMTINDAHGVVVLAASGMCEGGRILHHLKHQLWRKETRVVFVGFQARGTLGRALVEGAKRVRVMGEEIKVGAEVHTVGGFSAHADQSDLVRFVGRFAEPRPAVALVHGEPDRQEALGAKLHERYGIEALAPDLGEALVIPRSGRIQEVEPARRGRRRGRRAEGEDEGGNGDHGGRGGHHGSGRRHRDTSGGHRERAGSRRRR